MSNQPGYNERSESGYDLYHELAVAEIHSRFEQASTLDTAAKASRKFLVWSGGGSNNLPYPHVRLLMAAREVEDLESSIEYIMVRVPTVELTEAPEVITHTRDERLAIGGAPIDEGRVLSRDLVIDLATRDGQVFRTLFTPYGLRAFTSSEDLILRTAENFEEDGRLFEVRATFETMVDKAAVDEVVDGATLTTLLNTYDLIPQEKLSNPFPLAS